MTIHELIRQENLDEIKARLKDNAADIFAKEGDMELTPLHVAIQVSNEQIIELLLIINPDIIDIPNSIGDTSFQDACIKKDSLYMMRLLAEKGANVDRLDTSGASCLYNIILTAEEDRDNGNFHHYDKTKLLLELGANCHVTFFGDTLLDLIEEKKLSMDWWTLLLDVGAGIYTDFSKVNVDVAFLRKMTANQIVIGATKDGKLVDRTTPGFEEAHTNEEELKQAINAVNFYNFKALVKSTKHLIKDNPQNLELIGHLNRLIEIFESYRIKSIQCTTIDRLIKNSIFEENKDKIPSDLRAVCETREKQMEQQYLRGGLV